MRGEGRGSSKTVVNKYANFLSLTFSKIFTRQGITLVKINEAELKLKGRTMNIKQIIFRQFSKRSLSIFGNYCMSYKVVVLKGRWNISKNKIIETGVAVLYSINNRRIGPIWCQCSNFLCKLSFAFAFFLKMSKSKLSESISKSSDKE